MAPVYTTSTSKSTAATAADSLAEEPPFSALTTAGESLFMCSSKEGHVCYHACRAHGRYPLWSDDEFMVDDVDDEEEEQQQKEPEESSDCEFDSDEDWLSDGEDHAQEETQFWREIQESIQRQRRAHEQRRRTHYSSTDLRFLLADADSTPDSGPIVGVITTKPAPEYVWYMGDDSTHWMRGSLPQKLSNEQDGAYYRYKYQVWDRIPNEDVRDSSDDDEEEDAWVEVEHNDHDDDGLWSQLADHQEQQQQPS